jgi:hypothetical protein
LEALSTPVHDKHAIFVTQKVQPALLGLTDGSVSTLVPIFAVAGLTVDPLKAFYVDLAASLGAGISMGLAEASSDDEKITGRKTDNAWTHYGSCCRIGRHVTQSSIFDIWFTRSPIYSLCRCHFVWDRID